MFCLKDMSLWGAIPFLLLTAVALAILWLVDRRMLHKLPRLKLRRPHLSLRQWLLQMAAILIGTLAMAGALVLCLPSSMFLPLAGILFVCLLASVPAALQTYLRCLRHTEEHRRYLVANGASHLESVMPAVRRALRSALLPLLWKRKSPMMVALPLLFLALLMMNTTIAAALVTTLLLWAAAIVASFLSTLLLLYTLH